MLGVFDTDEIVPCRIAFQTNSDLIYLLRPTGWENESGIGGSAYLSLVHGQETGAPPRLDLDGEARVQRAVRRAIADSLLQSAHDCSEGGLAVALAESCLAGNVGAEVRIAISDFGAQDWAAILFGEAASRIVVSVPEGARQDALLDIAEAEGIDAVFIGQVKTNDRFDAAGMFDLPLSAVRDAHEGSIPRIMAGGTVL